MKKSFRPCYGSRTPFLAFPVNFQHLLWLHPIQALTIVFWVQGSTFIPNQGCPPAHKEYRCAPILTRWVFSIPLLQTTHKFQPLPSHICSSHHIRWFNFPKTP